MEENINYAHKVFIDERKSLSISGVKEVKEFDDETVILISVQGKMTVKGENLHIIKFNTESGDILVEGKIHALVYMSQEGKSGIISKIFR